MDRLTERFEEHRTRLRAVAYRMLGSASEAEDAVQDTWLRLNRTDAAEIENLGGWLTTVVARVCLNVLRSRDHRREEPLDAAFSEPADSTVDPAADAVLADSVGLAMLVVLDTLAPAERLAFVLHDMFAVPFDEIAPLIDRTPAAARQLASRARRRVQGRPIATEPDVARRRQVVDAYLTAARGGDFAALLELLHPDVVLRADKAAGPSREPIFLRGASVVARGAAAASVRAAVTQLALVNGGIGLVMADEGRPSVVLAFAFVDGKISEIDVIADRERVRGLDLVMVD
ncbi:RNA polymerase sigma 70 [Amycolatopsis sp. MJM2582]|uniref:sigma-70 family RNA polymerase sigma factor n=1 Tax=unclassified Amycolatopsis TaxID=2618356 RepID=UPI000505E5C4|nr:MULTISPECIES: sigma-70 family RNA polymerase sigma factor [unclassified Amycolatopsis]KFZ76662.1 RNA polymerase sigma 70 [Amycolatopsis sp. MJM2582]RSN42175.1 RNA polymerase subunit sigma-70 [Amycolatopsis sp. WAC 04197]